MPCTLHQTLTACIDCHQVAKKWLVIKMSDLRGLVTLLRKVGPIHYQSSRKSVIFKHHTFPLIHHGSSRKLHTGNTTSFIYQPFSHYSRSSSQKGEKRLKFSDNDQTKDVQMPEAKQDQLSELQNDYSLVLCPAESTLCLLLSLIYNARTILCSPKNLHPHPASHPSSQKLLSTLFLLFSAS